MILGGPARRSTGLAPSARVSAMPAAERLPRVRVRRRRRRGFLHPRRARLLTALFLAAALAALTLGSTLRDNGGRVDVGPIMPRKVLPASPPTPQVLATQAGLRLYVPIEQGRITAIAYHGVAGSRAFALEPQGHQANADVVQRLWRRVFGDSSGGMRYFVSDDSTDAVDVGALAGTQVYAPVDGVVASLAPEVIGSNHAAITVGISPTDDPSVVVYVAHLYPKSGIPKVGDSVTASRTPIGTVADLSKLEVSDLRKYVSDAGNDALVWVEPAPTLAVP
jgi:hypothetical protein